ncbi:hypothetical protein Efla_007547 [Eimeria flavescens]
MMASMSAEELADQPFSARVWASVGRMGSAYLNRSILYLKTRWLAFFACLAFYIVRVYFLAGFFVVTYGLGIYLLNLLIGFISPQIDPETEEYVLPVRGSAGGGSSGDPGEFRPFLRQVPEFKAWVAGMRALVIAIGMTFFEVFDLPVFWPILLVYFILLFVLTMKQQVKRMIKYNKQQQPHASQPWSGCCLRLLSSDCSDCLLLLPVNLEEQHSVREEQLFSEASFCGTCFWDRIPGVSRGFLGVFRLRRANAKTDQK